MIEIRFKHGSCVRLDQGRFFYDCLGDRHYVEAITRDAWTTRCDPAFDRDAAEAIVNAWGGTFRVVPDGPPSSPAPAGRRGRS